MTSTTIRIIAIAAALIALAAPAASAKPMPGDQGPQTSALAPKQDLRNPDQQAPAPAPKQDLRNADQRVAPGVPDFPTNATPLPRPQPEPAAVADDGGPSPFVYIVPSLVLIAMLAAVGLYARSARRPARA